MELQGRSNLCLQAHAPVCHRRSLPKGRIDVPRTRRRVCTQAQDEEYFDEGAAQVKRLLDRDRKELLREQNAKAEYDTEYDRPADSKQNGSSNGASTSKPAASDDAIEEELKSLRNPMRQAFKSAPKKGAFGSSTSSPFGSESGLGSQRDMWATMEPIEDDDEPWWKQISFGQVAIVLSFLTIIGLMLGTAWVTVKLGGVHFNE